MSDSGNDAGFLLPVPATRLPGLTTARDLPVIACFDLVKVLRATSNLCPGNGVQGIVASAVTLGSSNNGISEGVVWGVIGTQLLQFKPVTILVSFWLRDRVKAVK